MEQRTKIHELPWWATTTEDLSEGEPCGPTDLATRFLAAKFAIAGTPKIDAPLTGVDVLVHEEWRRDGSLGTPLHVEVHADDGRLDAAGARELAKALTLAADILEQIEGATRG